MSNQIIILGHNGMLGRMARLYFSEMKFEVITTEIRFSENTIEEFLSFICSYPNAIILNCIGRIKQKSNNNQELIWVNTVLPLFFKNIIKPNQILIHPSTDCVFSGVTFGKKSFYDHPDAKDNYGQSKYLGEIALQDIDNALVVRTSIIGYEFGNNGKGLLSWFLSHLPGDSLNGYINHFWNGVTTLEWCKQIHKIIMNFDCYRKINLVQLGSFDVYSKYDMLNLFQKVFNTEFNICKYETTYTVDRTLEPTHISESLNFQLEEMKSFLNI